MDEDAPQVEYDVSFSQKNMIIAINSFSGIGAHRSKLVDVILPGLLTIHAGLFTVVSKALPGAAGAAGAASGASNTEACVWNAKQAKSISNMNKNNMLKMLKFTSSVPWHEELVGALVALGAKVKAEKAQEMSQEAAVSVNGGKRGKQGDLEDYGNSRKRQRGMTEDDMGNDGKNK